MFSRSSPEKIMKKVIILQTSGNELANQLWNYASIYAYTLEQGYHLENPSFFEYGNYFTMPAPNAFFKAFFFNPFTNYTKRKTAFRRRVWRKMYFWYVNIVRHFWGNSFIIYKDEESKPYYLPPTKKSTSKLHELEEKGGDIYLDSWLFRNPAGIKKYYKEIKIYFRPRTDIKLLVDSQIKDLRTRYKSIVGVHIRQGDYKTWRNGNYFIEQKRVREIINEYILTFNKQKEEICLFIASDGPVDVSHFSGLNVVISKNNAIADLFLLASTDIIIGSNSTFGPFASYYGNIPFIVMQKKGVDWGYYTNKKEYFENKYSTMVHY